MTRIGILCFMFIVILLAGVSASAEVYSVYAHAVAGTYISGTHMTCVIDFGRSFASINSLSYYWSGFYMAGTQRALDGRITPYGGGFCRVSILDERMGDMNTVGFMSTSYNWDERYYVPVSQGSVFDGKATIDILYDGVSFNGMVLSPPQVNITDFTVLVDGVAAAVPEPSSTLVLGSGLLGLAGLVRRRRA